MKKGKQILALLICMLMVLSLSACGSGDSAAPPTADAPENTTEAPANDASADAADETVDTGDKVQLTFSLWGSDEEQKVTQEVLDKFNATQDRIEVNAIAIPWETYTEKLNTMATANELPDAGMVNEGYVIQYAEMGLLMDASEMYEGKAAPLDAITFKYEGKPVAYASSNEILMMYYNKDMFDAAGVDYPPNSADDAWTWDEFVDVAKQLTLDANGKTPNDADFDPNNIVQYGCMVENLTWQLEVWALSNGGGFYDADGNVTINDPAAIEAIQRVADLHLVHHVAPLSTGLTDDGVPRSLVAGTVAMTTNGAWNQGTALYADGEYVVNYGVGVLPYMQEKVSICTSGTATAFSQTKYPEETMEFIRWYNDPDNNWGLIESGIWMPNLESYYTDETLTKKWLDNPAYLPMPEIKPVLVDYTRDYVVSTSWFYVNNTGDFNALLGDILGTVWTGDATAEEVITANLDALEAAHNGM